MGSIFSSSKPTPSQYKYNTYADFQYLGANGIDQINPNLVNPKITNPTKVRLSADQQAAISNLLDKKAEQQQNLRTDFTGGKRRKRKNHTKKRASKKSRRAK